MDAPRLVAACIRSLGSIVQESQTVTVNSFMCKRLAERTEKLLREPLTSLQLEQLDEQKQQQSADAEQQQQEQPTLEMLTALQEILGETLQFISQWVVRADRPIMHCWRTASNGKAVKNDLTDISSRLMREAENALHRFRATAVGFSELQRDEEDRNDELQDFIAMQEMIEKEMDSTTVSEEEMETLCGILGKLRWSADWHFIGFEEIPYASLTITGESIGEGGFGVIKKAYYAGVQVAVKELRPELRFNNSDLAAFRGQVKDLEELRRKIKLNAGLKFPYIVQLFGACTVPPTICLVMELSDHGSLYDVLKRAREK
ncbi:kinase-like domain-containing protein, partial [Tribonema minus]